MHHSGAWTARQLVTFVCHLLSTRVSAAPTNRSVLQEAAKDKESLKSHGVTHVLTVNGKDPAFEDDFEYK